jgi:lipid-binding SYLF domain-containing protein
MMPSLAGVFRVAGALLLAALLPACQSTGGRAPTAEEQREAIRRYSDESLERLFAEHPAAKAQLEAAAGYAVFELNSVNAVWVIGQLGRGMLVNNKTRVPHYMMAMRAGTGPGIGYQELRQVFVFANETSMEMFLLGNAAGADLNASATLGTMNVQQSFNPFVTTYQTTDVGFAVQANWGGTVYVSDPDLACEGGTCPPLEARGEGPVARAGSAP